MVGFSSSPPRLVLGGNKTTNIFDRRGDKLVDIDVISLEIFSASPPTAHGKSQGGENRPEKRRQAAKSTIQQQQQQQTVHAPLAAVLLEALRKTPVRRADETPARLYGSKPPYGLMGDPSQLGEWGGGQLARLRGAARAGARAAVHADGTANAGAQPRIGRQQEPIPDGRDMRDCRLERLAHSERPWPCDRRAPRRDAL